MRIKNKKEIRKAEFEKTYINPLPRKKKDSSSDKIMSLDKAEIAFYRVCVGAHNEDSYGSRYGNAIQAVSSRSKKS